MKKQLSLVVAATMLAGGTMSLAAQALPAPDARHESPRALLNVVGYQSFAPVGKPAAKAPALAKSSDFTNRTFGGALISADSWMDMWITEVPYGLYDFTVSADGISSNPTYTHMSADWMSGAVKRGRFYGIRNVNMMGALTGVVNSEIDMTEWAELRSEFADEPSFGMLPTVMAYDYASGDIYGIFYNDDLTAYNWSRYNTLTLEQEVICQFNGRFNPVAMASAPDGKIYVVTSEGDLYTVNRNNSRVSLVGHTGVNVIAYSQAMTWDTKTNTFLWAAMTPTGSALYSLDPEGPSSTLIKRFGDNEQWSALYMKECDQMLGAPAAPSEPVWNFSTPGGASGTINFTCSDAGELTVYLDGEVVKDSEAVSAGQAISVPFAALDNRTHHVSAMQHNSTGWSPVAESFCFVGLDVPLAVTDVVFTENAGEANVSWAAPAGGVEGGYIDPSQLYYKVYRLPDGIEVASHHTSTVFTEALPTGVKRYAYRVVPFNGADKQGEATLSNALVYGNSYEVPFADDFTMENAIDVYTLIDGDGDGQNWNINANSATPYLSSSVTYDQNVDVTDNWILSPKIKFEGGNVYRVTMHMRNTWAGSPDYMAVGFCDGANDSKDGLTIIDKVEVNTPSMTLLDHNVDFTIEKDSDYKIGLGFITPRGQGGGVFMDLFKVDLVGKTTSPAAVTDLTVTPDADRLPKAGVSFTAPSTALDGSALSGDLTAVIYRDGEKIGELTGVKPGAAAEWSDETSPAAGTHTYTVRMANDSGEGMDASASAFVGIYSVPFVDPIATKDAMSYYTFRTKGFEDNPLNSEMHFPSYGDPCLEVDHMNYTQSDHEMWVILPLLDMEGESAYRISYEVKAMKWCDELSMELVYGDSPEPEALTSKAFDVELPEGYDFEAFEHLMVLTNDGGHKYLAFHITGPKNGYLYWYLRNINIERVGSALAPDVVTDVVATSDLTSKLTMKAPSVDYAGRDLTGLDKVEVYRNGSVLPVYTFEQPKPGEELEWVDENAILGYNSYFIVPSNSYGRGNAVTVKSFIGYDNPVAPDGLSIVPSADNQSAVITWERPRRGENGGVLNEDEMSFVLVQLFPDETDENKQIKVLKTGITSTTVTPERAATDNQELIYYGIATATPQGISAPALYYTILGKPYAYPFSENFAGGEAESSMWLNAGSASYGLQAMPTSDAILAYNGYSGQSQDGDEGFFMFLNGAMSENPIPFAVLSPKVSLEGAVKPELSFWLYKGNHCGDYYTVPSLHISASTDESEFIELGNEDWGTAGSPAWVECRYSLDSFVGKPGALIFQFLATAGGMNDIMLMDNFRVGEYSSVEGVGAEGNDVNVIGLHGGILTRGGNGSTAEVYNAAGVAVGSFTADDTIHTYPAGLYLVRLAGRVFKVVVK